MPIDPSIILGVKPAQFTPPDPLERLGKSLTLQHLLQQGEKTQRDASREARLEALFGSNPNATSAEVMAIDPTRGIAFRKAEQDAELQRSTIGLNKAKLPQIQQETLTKAVAAHRDQLAGVNDPQSAAQWVAAGYQDPTLAPLLSRAGPLEQVISQIPTDPQAFQQWKQQHALGATEYIKQNAPKITTQNLGGTERILATPGLGGAPTVLNETRRTNTPDALLTDERTRAEGAANRGVTMRGQSMTDARARDLATIQRDQGRVPPGYRMTPEGNLAPIPGGPAELGKALPNPAINALASAGSAAEDSRRLAASFQPEYGGKWLLGDMANTYKRVVGDKTGQAQWWQDMDARQNQVRNALFGSALTATELAAWNKASVSPRMDPEQIQANLTRQQEIEARAASKLARAYESGGYNKQQIKELLGPAAQYLDAPAPVVAPSAPTPAAATKLRGKLGSVLTQNPDGSYNYGRQD